jgi:putative ABC transport system permease protein
VIRYAWRDLVRNPRRTLASLIGVALGVGLFSGILFFIDGSAATMTQRAIAPVTLDIQRIVTAEPTGLSLTERIGASGAMAEGQRTTIEIAVTSNAGAPANEVVIHDEPPRPLRYVAGTTTLDGSAVPDIDGDSPLSHGVAGFGMNVGRLDAQATATVTYDVEATAPVPDVSALRLRGTVSSRESQIPIEANAGPVLTLDELLARIAAIPGVAAADGLGMVDLPPGSLAGGGAPLRDPVRVFAFDQRYLDHYPSIAVVSGELRDSSALLSVEAARSLGVEPGGAIDLTVPGREQPLRIDVSGIVDLAQAQPLFESRKASKLEEFLYVPNAVVVSPAMFRDVIVPAFNRARATVGTITKSFPVLEADVLLQREPLQADPATALEQTSGVARSIDEIAPEQGYVIDNISNALSVASVDAATGRRMFLFLGVPGALLAAFLAAYAASILAATERREHAILRVRGADRGHLRTVVLTKSLVLASVGSLAGVALGAVWVAIVLGSDTLFAASSGDLVRSALVSGAVGLMVTAVALYVPAGRSVRRDVSEQRRAMRTTSSIPWRRIGLDVALLVAALVAEIVAIRSGALDPPTGSVYAGLAISLPTSLLPAPLLVWVGGSLLCVRALLGVAAHAPGPSAQRFGGVVAGVVSRSIRRRSRDLAGGVIGVGLVVGFGTSLALFAGTYDEAKAADARFALGSDLRITPSVLATTRLAANDGSMFLVPGVRAVSPVVFDLENAVLIGRHNQQRENLAAIDPASIGSVAPLPDEVFVDASAAATMDAFAHDPRGVLIDEETADDLSVDVEDPVEIILALGTRREVHARFRVAGLFERFPGMPQGANLIVHLDRYAATTGLRPVDFFLASVEDPSSAGLARATDATTAGPGATTPIHVDTTDTTVTKDESSLTAVNVNGLVRLNTAFALAMSAIAIAIFVFGLLLHRRGEYVALRAQGLRAGELRALVVLEAAVVTVCGSAVGLLVGALSAYLSIGVLRGLFVLDPHVTFAPASLAVLASTLVAAAVVSGLAATELLRRLNPAEILREE